MRKTIFFATLISIAGCSDDISLVKESYIDPSRTTTINQSLNNRDICENIEWSKLEDDKGRNVVQYTCIFIETKDFLKKNREDAISSWNNRNINEIKNIQEDIKDKESTLNNYITNGDAIVTEKSKNHVERTHKLEKSRFYDSVNSVIKKIQDANEENIESTLIGFVNDVEFSDLIFTMSNDNDMREIYGRYNGREMNSFRAQISHMQRKRTEEERAVYKKENVDQYLNQMKSDINKIIEYSINWVSQQDKAIEDNTEATKKSLVEKIKEEKEFLTQEIDFLKNAINSKKEYLRVKEEETNSFDEAALKEYPYYDNISEVFQWVVNKDGESTLTYGAVIANQGSTKKVLYKHSDLNRALTRMLDIRTTKYDEYIKNYASGDFIKFIEDYKND